MVSTAVMWPGQHAKVPKQTIAFLVCGVHFLSETRGAFTHIYLPFLDCRLNISRQEEPYYLPEAKICVCFFVVQVFFGVAFVENVKLQKQQPLNFFEPSVDAQDRYDEKTDQACRPDSQRYFLPEF